MARRRKLGSRRGRRVGRRRRVGGGRRKYRRRGGGRRRGMVRGSGVPAIGVPATQVQPQNLYPYGTVSAVIS